MKFDVITLFPELFQPFSRTSILQRGQETALLEISSCDLRTFAQDKHQTVDDTPYGGGPGMILKIEPIDKALRALQIQNSKLEIQNSKTVVLSARGEQFTQHKAQEYSQLDQLILICGRYEGIDQRVIDHLADEELSIGPYVLAGGEAAAMVVIEATARLIPGVLGNPLSLEEESYSKSISYAAPTQTGRSVEYPQYTRPEEYKGWSVPSVLLSGDHEKIKKWRNDQQKG